MTDDSVDVARGTAKVGAILHPNGGMVPLQDGVPMRGSSTAGTLGGVAPKPRRTRSDAGRPREKKPVAAEGKLSKEQIEKLRELEFAMSEAREANKETGKALVEAQLAWQVYLIEITAK